MEFGARMCKPQNPDCTFCPLSNSCMAFSKNMIKELPVKLKKIKIKNRFFNYLVIESENDSTIIEKRKKGIWINLYEFPLIESTEEIDEEYIINHDMFNDLVGSVNTSVKLFNNNIIIHKLSHQHIYAKFWIIKTTSSSKFSIKWNSINKYPVSTLIDNFLIQYKKN